MVREKGKKLIATTEAKRQGHIHQLVDYCADKTDMWKVATQ
jgi:hypothetical protein